VCGVPHFGTIESSPFGCQEQWRSSFVDPSGMEGKMPYPANDDLDLNKKRSERPGAGRIDAPQNQTSRTTEPQQPPQQDQRKMESGQGPDGRAHEVASGEGEDRTVSEQDIAIRAYQLWEADDRPEGMDRKHWQRAEDELRRR
jgi:hypothetical protein